MYQPDRMSQYHDFMSKADSGLDRLLADFQSVPSMAYDDAMLPPDVLLPPHGM
jgi:hypothetical protein